VIGAELTSSPIVRMLTFTGSTEIGKVLIEQCAKTVKKVGMELGGNAPFLVFDDADLDKAVVGAMASKYRNAGQTCVCANRIYVQDGVYDKFAEKLAAEVKKLKVGNGTEPGVTTGPLINKAAIDKVEEHIADATSKGAKVILGGKRHALGGSFFEPTVLTGVTPEMKVAREETFGPVAPLVRCKDIDEAIELADRSEYGLGASIYTNSLEHAFKAMERIRAGTFWVNDPLTDNDAGPFGGMRRSGLGRELGSEGLEDFRDSKHVHLDYVIGAKPYWFPYRFDRPE
jgi:succinate-semialdehyde dehydrogenase/glutarate-semialdehyde dehydrogenase